jgi:hypothetical protein
MALLTPKTPKYFENRAKRRTKAQLGKPYAKSLKEPVPKVYKGKVPEFLLNGLCREARKLLGGKVPPRYIQEASVKLYQHLAHGGGPKRPNGLVLSLDPPCPVCKVPNKVADNAPIKVLERKIMKKTGLGDTLPVADIDRKLPDGRTVREVLESIPTEKGKLKKLRELESEKINSVLDNDITNLLG